MITERITLKDINDMFSSTVYRRGLGYYREGRVRDLIHDPIHNRWTATVKGSESYMVLIENDSVELYSECDCPAYIKYWSPCKHIAAVLIKIYDSEESFSDTDSVDLQPKLQNSLKQKQLEPKKQEQDRQAIYVKHLTDQFIQAMTHHSQKNTAEWESVKSLLMVDWIVKIQKQYSSKQFLTVEMKVGQKRTYVVKKIKEFLSTITKGDQYPFTKSFTYHPAEHSFSEEDQEIINLLLEAMKHEETFRAFQPSYYQSYGASNDRVINIPPMLADDFLNLIRNMKVCFEFDGKSFSELNIFQDELPFSVKLDKGKSGGFQLELSQFQAMTFLDLYGYLVQDNRVYKLLPDQQLLIKELTKLVNVSRSSTLPIANDQIDSFISQVVPIISKIGHVEMTESVSNQIIKFPLQAKMFVDLNDDQLNVSLEFHYGEHKINPFKSLPTEKGNPIIMREVEKEQSINDIIESSSLRLNVNGLYTDDEDGMYEFLYEVVPKLDEKVDIYFTNPVKKLMLPDQNESVFNIDVNTSGSWLEIGFDIAGIEKEDIRKILKFAVEKKRYYRLPSGAFVSLETDEYKMIQTFMEEFNLKPQQLQEDSIKLPIYRGIQLDEMFNNDNGSKAKYGRQFRRLINRLNNPEELDFDLPETLHAELRDYQQYGYEWLRTLRSYNLGGILADDMGLGKTLQSITFILSLFSEKKDMKMALIVAPASLVYNWKNEFQKFAPTLTVEVMIGSPKERKEKLQSETNPHVWITSYPTLRQDIEYYEQQEFSTMILDEAQVIKNYSSKTAKTVRGIKTETCFALSGTPIENSIDELWSIFQTVIPNFFPQQKVFRQLEPDKISRMIRPFLLRRLKKDVLKELPDKIETVNYSELTKEQKELYVAYLEKIRNETKESLQIDGFQKSQIKILAGLTRLRQLCCHPSLFLENYDGDSGKLEQLMEVVGNAIEGGRRILIFSQFTSMLSLIREQLIHAGLDFFYLDGQTKPAERVKMVEQFNQGDGDVFLISLKAGNTGLNLTGADTVILYDLWWNPAVEEQAAGRAHRIGQKKVVQVIRLITQGTIEEKIYELQQRKRELIDTVVETGNKEVTKITEQEIRELLNI